MWYTISITLFFICKFSQVQCLEDCESLRNCQQCIREPLCGWYLQYRSANGSGCFKNNHVHKTEGSSHPPNSSLYIVKNESDGVISPQEVSLNLRVNEPFTFPITFTPRRATWGKTSVELKRKVKRSGSVKVTFFSDCNGQHEPAETNKCDNVEFGDSVEFVVKVEQVRCSRRQPERVKTIEINPLPSPVIFRISLYAYCFCPCELEGGTRFLPEKIPECHGRGRFVCGVCYCNEGYAGDNCEINTTNTISE